MEKSLLNVKIIDVIKYLNNPKKNYNENVEKLSNDNDITEQVGRSFDGKEMFFLNYKKVPILELEIQNYIFFQSRIKQKNINRDITIKELIDDTLKTYDFYLDDKEVLYSEINIDEYNFTVKRNKIIQLIKK